MHRCIPVSVSKGNMMNFTKYLKILILFTVLPCNLSLADSVKRETKTFDSITKQVNKWAVPDSTLVVMDNDDTLTMMSCPDRANTQTCQYLGGAAWYAWQEDQIAHNRKPRVAENETDLINVSGLLFSMSNMVYTRKNVASTLNELTNKGVHLLVETARGNGNVTATEAQFSLLNVTKDSTLKSLISSHSLNLNQGGIASKASPYIPCENTSMRAITYQNGVMYLAGQDKGNNLKCMLDSYNAQKGIFNKITHVVFIDDTLKNVTSVQQEFSQSPDYVVLALHYTALATHKSALTKGSKAGEYQQVAMDRWYRIKSAMELSLLDPTLPE
jgi:hypothetical protein